MKKQRILFIGAGRMAEAIIAGLLGQEADQLEEVVVANRSDAAKLAALHEQYGVTVTQDWQTAVAAADVVLLAMPPGAHKAVLAELAPLLHGQLVLSVAAGIGLQLLETALPPGTPVAWVMPNTAAGIGESISLFTCGAAMQDEQRAVLAMILRSIGQAAEVTEQQIHDLTAVTGSAPAFLYRFAEALELAALDYGVTRDQARQLVGQMIYGSAALLRTGTPAEELRDAVTTPGGATAAGLRVLDSADYLGTLKQAVVATNERAREMAQED